MKENHKKRGWLLQRGGESLPLFLFSLLVKNEMKKGKEEREKALHPSKNPHLFELKILFLDFNNKRTSDVCVCL